MEKGSTGTASGPVKKRARRGLRLVFTSACSFPEHPPGHVRSVPQLPAPLLPCASCALKCPLHACPRLSGCSSRQSSPPASAPSACTSFRNVSTYISVSPPSIRLTVFGLTPAFSASASCDSPADSRRSLMRLPRQISSCDSARFPKISPPSGSGLAPASAAVQAIKVMVHFRTVVAADCQR